MKTKAQLETRIADLQRIADLLLKDRDKLLNACQAVADSFDQTGCSGGLGTIEGCAIQTVKDAIKGR